MEQNEIFGQNNDMTTALDMPEVPAAPQTEVLMDDAVMQAPAWEAPVQPAAPTWEAPAQPAAPAWEAPAAPAWEAPAEPAAPTWEAPVQPAAPTWEAPVQPAAPAWSAPAAPTPEPKKKSKLPLILAIAGAAVVGLIIFLVLFFTVIRPNGIYNDAVEALNRKDYVECERLLNSIPDHEKTPDLKKDLNIAMAETYIAEGELDAAEALLATMPGDARAKGLKDDITYLRAAELVAQGKYEDAQIMMDKIPNHEDPDQLREELRYQGALAAIEEGDYEFAYEEFTNLGEYKDSKDQKQIVYYEALAFRTLLQIQDSLKDPSSLRVKTFTFHVDDTNDERKGEIDCCFEITGKNTYGGTASMYGYELTMYDGSGSPTIMNASDYNNPGDYYELLLASVYDIVDDEPLIESNIDIARMNRLLENGATFKIGLTFSSEEVVES